MYKKSGKVECFFSGKALEMQWCSRYRMEWYLSPVPTQSFFPCPHRVLSLSVCLGNERTRVKWKTLLWENQITLRAVCRNCWGTKIFLVPFLCSFSSVQLVMSNSLRPHGLQHAGSPCPSPTPRVYSNSHPLSQWCHPTISSSVVNFSSCLPSFPASGSFQMSQLFASGAKVLEFQLQHQSFQWTPRTDLL